MPSPSPPAVRLDVDDRGAEGRVARITVDNAAKINILNSPLMDQFNAAIEALRDDADLRAVVLTGAGDRAFIGGADIREMAGLNPESAMAFITRLHEVCQGLRDLPVPVIARISGYCLGAGLEVAAACDLRAADETATFGMPEVQVGIPSVIEAALLPRLVGWGKARELVYTGRLVDAQEALQCGLVERVVPPDQLDAAVEDWVSAIVSAGPRAIRLQKSLIRKWEELPLEEAIEAGITTFGNAYTTDEPRDAMKGFLERKRSD